MSQADLEAAEILGSLLLQHDSEMELTPKEALARWHALPAEEQHIRIEEHELDVLVGRLAQATNSSDPKDPIEMAELERAARIQREFEQRVAAWEAEGTVTLQ